MEEVKDIRNFMKKFTPNSLEENEVEKEVEEELIITFTTNGMGLETVICKGEELKQMKKLADNIYNTFLELEGYKITLPIKKINGLRCDPIFHIDKRGTRYCISFKVESSQLFEEEDEDLIIKSYFYNNFGCPNEDEFDKDIHILHSLIKIKYLLENLQYCYASNKLTLYINDNLELLTSVFDNPNIEMCAENCCVCLTTTTNKTPCKHSLCFICWEQIKIHKDEEADEYKLDCPICRENIRHTD